MTNTQTPDPYPPASATPTGNAAGTAALVLGIVVVALGVTQQILAYTASFWIDAVGGFDQMGVVFTGISLVSGAIAIAGVIAGAVGIQPARVRGRLAAAAGLAVSAAHLLGIVIGLLLPVILDLFL
jgi:hypothetical protein